VHGPAALPPFTFSTSTSTLTRENAGEPIERAGEPGDPCGEGGDCRHYVDLRHTCASLAVSAGVNVLALQRMLGASAKMTLDTHADLFDDDLDSLGAGLHSRYSRENVAKMWPRSV
jgi:site-specific recombinase XerD